MVPWSRRRRLSVSSLAFAGWTRRFRRARDPGTTVAWSVSGRVRRHDVAREYGARPANESLPLTLIGSGRASRALQGAAGQNPGRPILAPSASRWNGIRYAPIGGAGA